IAIAVAVARPDTQPNNPGPSPSILPVPDDMLERLQPHQHLARLRPVGRPQDADVVQLVDDARRAPVADTQPALEQRRRALVVLDADLGGLAEERVALFEEVEGVL